MTDFPRDASVTVICGGVGAARFLRGLMAVVDPQNITAIVNVADDITLHGLHISPDLDTCVYTLANAINPETGWGLRDETWNAMDTLGRYGGPDWFNLGDRDLGTHLYRTHRLSEGATLAEVTAEITAAWDLGLTIIPVTNDPIETRVTVADEGNIGFQEYFVRRQHDVVAESVEFVGADAASPSPGVLDAIAGADVVVIAPSNPIVSIGPVLAVPGVQDAIASRRDACVAISPIIGGKALKGPADRLMRELGHEATVVGVTRIYAPFCSTLLVDDVDAASAPAVEDAGMHCVVRPTIMSGPEESAALAVATVRAALGDEG